MQYFHHLKTQWRAVTHQFIQANPGKIITKFNFTVLLSRAWVKVVTPGNVIPGFKTCGVYPFNPKAIEVSKDDDGDIAVVSEGNVDTDSDITVENDTDEVQQSFPNASFTVEQEQLFKCHFEKGYNIFIDGDYVRWLKLHHPESCPNDGSNCELNNDSIISQLSDIIPASPVLFLVLEESEELASQLEFASVLNTVDESMTDIPISTTGNTVTVVGPSTSSVPLSVAGPSTSSTALSVTSPSTSFTPLSVPGSSTSSTPLTSILGTPVHI